MSDRRPLVLDDNAATEQLQPPDDLDIPLRHRVDDLEKRFNGLVLWMLNQGFEIPSELLEDC